MNETTLLAVVTAYHEADGSAAGFSELRASVTDESIDEVTMLVDALDAIEAKDGDEIEIIVRRTGCRPFGDRLFRRTGRRTFEREVEIAAPSAISAPREGGAS